MVMSLFVEAGPAAAGWTIYPPLSALPQAQPGSGLGMTLWLVSMAIFIASSLLGSLNYIVTVLNLRTKGMTMTRLPLTIWAFFVTAIIGVVSFPVLLSAALLLIMDRSFGTSFFLSDIFIQGEVLHYQGGSPVLYEHLFWFLGHPEVYCITSSLGDYLRNYCNQRPKTNLWLSRHGSLHFSHCLPFNHCLGAPYVYLRNESFPWVSIYIYHPFNCDSFSSKSI